MYVSLIKHGRIIDIHATACIHCMYLCMSVSVDNTDILLYSRYQIISLILDQLIPRTRDRITGVKYGYDM